MHCWADTNCMFFLCMDQSILHHWNVFCLCKWIQNVRSGNISHADLSTSDMECLRHKPNMRQKEIQQRKEKRIVGKNQISLKLDSPHRTECWDSQIVSDSQIVYFNYQIVELKLVNVRQGDCYGRHLCNVSSSIIQGISQSHLVVKWLLNIRNSWRCTASLQSV